MKSEDVTYAVTCDLAGKLRGKGFPSEQFEKREKRGIGWAPTNVQITCFDAIAPTPFGALGDMVMLPDPQARVILRSPELGLKEDFALSDIRYPDGRAWECCTRSILKAALDRLRSVSGLELVSTFEHEFQFKSTDPTAGRAYSLAGFRARRDFCEKLIAAMRETGLDPDTVMREYGAEQYEITMGPTKGVVSADQAVIVRELVRALANSEGEDVTFTPISDTNGVGNGVHVHMSFLDAEGSPVTYDPDRPYNLGLKAGQFIAGALKYINDYVALTAPSAISYLRLTPHRWSAAYNNLGLQDREAAIRICPLSDMSDIGRARQFNFEFRAADAAASPHLQLAAIIHAGVQGIEEGLEVPAATGEDISLLTSDELTRRGLKRLPENLEAALAEFESSAHTRQWFSDHFVDVYLSHKRGELAVLDAMELEERVSAYREVY